jgi:hypothetical protein
MTGDALAAYLQTVVESESARANALQAQGEALQAQYTAQQAVAVYQRAQPGASGAHAGKGRRNPWRRTVGGCN